MKKPLFSLAFLLSIIVVSFTNVNGQSINSFFNIKIFEENVVQEQKEGSTIRVFKEDTEKDDLIKDAQISKSNNSKSQPSSSRISIGLGKVLFEKYIK